MIKTKTGQKMTPKKRAQELIVDTLDALVARYDNHELVEQDDKVAPVELILLITQLKIQRDRIRCMFHGRSIAACIGK